MKRIRASLVCVHDGKLLVFKGVDPTSKREYWFLPGGKIEAGESPLECAVRETKEETGYDVSAAPNSEILKHYSHDWNGATYQCQTYFYKGSLIGEWHRPERTDDDHYNLGPSWIALAEIEAAFGYTPEIFEAVSSLIKS